LVSAFAESSAAIQENTTFQLRENKMYKREMTTFRSDAKVRSHRVINVRDEFKILKLTAFE
jgi:hypothetical protein